jgi:hypothetical protein
MLIAVQDTARKMETILMERLVPTTGLEPVRCYSLEPESSASANSATWATLIRYHLHAAIGSRKCDEYRRATYMKAHDERKWPIRWPIRGLWSRKRVSVFTLIFKVNSKYRRECLAESTAIKCFASLLLVFDTAALRSGLRAN